MFAPTTDHDLHRNEQGTTKCATKKKKLTLHLPTRADPAALAGALDPVLLQGPAAELLHGCDSLPDAESVVAVAVAVPKGPLHVGFGCLGFEHTS